MIDPHRFSAFSLASKAIHGYAPADTLYRSVACPIYQTSTFVNPALGSDIRYSYSRCDNPTRTCLEDTIALLEGGRAGFAFSSGLAAVLAVFSLLKSGDHVIVSDDVYGGTYRQINELWKHLGIAFDAVDIGNTGDVRAHVLPNTRMIYAETPTNPMMKVADIAALADIAHQNGALLAVDNTFLTPIFQRPLSLGADIVLHSATKYLSGHHDTLAGLATANDQAVIDRLELIKRTQGTGLAPFDCFLVLRGMKTLELRMKRHEENAMAVAAWLKNNKNVEAVHFIGLPDHPSYAVTKRQCDGFGGMISFTLRDARLAEKVLCGGKLIRFAESLGGADTLITYPLTQTHASVPKEVREKLGITEKLLRLSVGIEPAEDILADLARMLGENAV